MIFIPRLIAARGKRQQPFRLRLNRDHPLAFRLVSVVVPDGLGNIIDYCRPRQSTGNPRSLRARGLAIPGLSWSMSNASTTDLDFTAAPHSAAAVGYINSTGVANNITFLGRYNFVSSSDNQGWAITTNGNTDFRSFIFNNNASTALASTGVTPAVGDWTLGHSEDGTTRKIYVNGVLNNSATGLNHTSPTCVSGTGYTSEQTRFDLYIGAAWNRVLTDQEMLLFHADPFSMFKPDVGFGMLHRYVAPTLRRSNMFSMFPP